MSERYGATQVRLGMIHFATGKGVSSIAGFLAMIMVVRLLSIESFAAYSVLTAFVEILNALSGLGLAHVLLRYVPELYTKHYRVALRALIVRATLLRGSILVIISLVCYLLADTTISTVGLGNAVDAFKVFLLVVVLRSTTQFLSQILESTLHQGLAQLAFAVGAVARLGGMVALSTRGDINLVNVIWIEAIADTLALLVAGYGVIKVAVSSPALENASTNDKTWFASHFRALIRFSANGYLQHLAILPYGGHTNRLIAGNILAPVALANYGFAQTLYEYVKRYLPAQLLVGLIRPIVVSRYVIKKDFAAAARLCGQVLQINLLLMGAGFALLTVVGPDLLRFISNDKYGSDATFLIAALFVVLILETQRQQLELLVQTIEKYQLLIPSNLLLSCSAFLAIVIVPLFGAIAFPLTNAIGLVAANEWVRRRMCDIGAKFTHDWLETFCTLCATVGAISTGLIVRYWGLHWALSAVVTLLVYAYIGYLLSRQLVMSFINELMIQTHKNLPALAPSIELKKLKIAFCVLSSKHSQKAIDILAKQVAPHPVYVHHDFSKQPDFVPLGENIIILKNPVATAWGDWSLVEGTFRLMRSALDDPAVTHFQLLSESCLLIKPIVEYENYLKVNKPDFMIDIISMKDKQAQRSHGWRYFSINTFSRRILRRLSVWCFYEDSSYLSTQSINLKICTLKNSIRLRALVGKLFINFHWIIFHRKLKVMGLETMAIGGQWFGTSRSASQWLLDSRDSNQLLTSHFQKCHIPDEAFFQTLVINGILQQQPFTVLPSNHYTSWASCGTGPDILTPQDIKALASCQKFFARKAPLETDSPIRILVLGLHFKNTATADN